MLLAEELLGLALHSKTKRIKKFKHIQKNLKTKLYISCAVRRFYFMTAAYFIDFEV